MPEQRPPARRTTTFILTAFLLLVLTACGGPAGPPKPPQPPPGELRTVTGNVSLPTGHAVDLASLTVSTPTGISPISASGEFTITVFSGAATEVGVETASGELLLLGVTEGASGSDTMLVSLTSTAESLLYYLVGGMWLPPEQQDKVRSLLQGAPAATNLAAELERQLMADGNGVTEPDAGLLAALDAAHATLLGDARLSGLATDAAYSMMTPPNRENAIPAENQFLIPAAVDGSNILIEPTSAQAGVEVLHNPSGAGVVAQNSYRRPAALLAYEVAWEDADRVEHQVDPPHLVERVELPATGQLEFLTALVDVVTGSSPWSPVLSPPLALAGREGASRTHYQLILIGPSATDAAWPIMNNPRFSSFHDSWDDIATEKSVDLFGLGVYLTQGQVGYGNALRFLMAELVENRTYRLDMLNVVEDALAEGNKNKAAIDAMETRLSSRASASAIAAAVQTALVSGDVAKIMYDLASSPRVIDWTVVSAPSLFSLTPAQARVSRNDASARFMVFPKGQTTGTFLFRWTTSGNHGELSDLLKNGVTITTTSREIWYFHNSPLGIEDTDRDTITVEVFEAEPGATSIPPGASPIARMAAEVRGDDRILDAKLEVKYGATSPDRSASGRSFECAEMYLRFPAEKGAKSYSVSLRNVGGQGDERNSNQDFQLRGPNHTVFIDPNARIVGRTAEDGFTPDYYGVCDWRSARDPTVLAGAPHVLSRRFDRDKNEYVVTLFAVVDYSGLIENPVAIDPRISLWIDWVEYAEFVVAVNK